MPPAADLFFPVPLHRRCFAVPACRCRLTPARRRHPHCPETDFSARSFCSHRPAGPARAAGWSRSANRPGFREARTSGFDRHRGVDQNQSCRSHCLAQGNRPATLPCPRKQRESLHHLCARRPENKKCGCQKKKLINY